MCLKDWAKYLNMPYSSLLARLNKGETIENIVKQGI